VLEEKRNEKLIGASLEASVRIAARGDALDLLKQYEDQLTTILIVSKVELQESTSGELQIEVGHAPGAKCERCWNWSETVGSDERYPTLDARCVRQIEEGWGGGQA
jgi:isoleucyl-tRNA synthetase